MQRRSAPGRTHEPRPLTARSTTNSVALRGAYSAKQSFAGRAERPSPYAATNYGWYGETAGYRSTAGRPTPGGQRPVRRTTVCRAPRAAWLAARGPYSRDGQDTA